MSSAEVRIGARRDRVDPDARAQVQRGQPGVVRERGLGGAVGDEAAAGQPSHGRGDVDDAASAGVLKHQRNGGRGERVRGRDVEGERVPEVAWLTCLPTAPACVPPTLLTTMSSLPNASTALPASLAVSSGCARSATTISARRPVAWICSATSSKLGLRPGRNDHVRTGFRECQRHRGTQPAARSGHHRDLVVQPKPVKNHLCLPSFAGRTVAGVGGPRDVFLKHVLVFSGRGVSSSQTCHQMLTGPRGRLLRRGFLRRRPTRASS